MKKVKKIEIKINGKVIKIKDNIKLSALLKNLKIPIKKVAIELNQEIISNPKQSELPEYYPYIKNQS